MSLTDDWKANRLCYGKSYWCCGEDGQIEICTLGCNNKFYSGDYELEGIEEVLAICDYEELQRLKEENKRMAYDLGNQGYKIKNQRHEINNRLSEINHLKQLLKEKVEDLQKDLKNALWYQSVQNEEINNLRNLLKDCQKFLYPSIESDRVIDCEGRDLLSRIEEEIK